MADAKHGAVHWLEYSLGRTDLLSIVDYDDVIATTLPQTQVSGLRRARGPERQPMTPSCCVVSRTSATACSAPATRSCSRPVPGSVRAPLPSVIHELQPVRDRRRSRPTPRCAAGSSRPSRSSFPRQPLQRHRQGDRQARGTGRPARPPAARAAAQGPEGLRRRAALRATGALALQPRRRDPHPPRTCRGPRELHRHAPGDRGRWLYLDRPRASGARSPPRSPTAGHQLVHRRSTRRHPRRGPRPERRAARRSTLSDQLAGGGGSPASPAGMYDPTGTAGAARLVQGEGRRG